MMRANSELKMTMSLNNSRHANRRPPFGFGRAAGFFGRWIPCQCPFPEAVRKERYALQ
jgi:hypothetical protein